VRHLLAWRLISQAIEEFAAAQETRIFWRIGDSFCAETSAYLIDYIPLKEPTEEHRLVAIRM
jgi:hypothetical protein